MGYAFEDDIISYHPDSPGHSDNYFHGKKANLGNVIDELNGCFDFQVDIYSLLRNMIKVLIVVVLFHDFLEMKHFSKELYRCASKT